MLQVIGSIKRLCPCWLAAGDTSVSGTVELLLSHWQCLAVAGLAAGSATRCIAWWVSRWVCTVTASKFLLGRLLPARVAWYCGWEEWCWYIVDEKSIVTCCKWGEQLDILWSVNKEYVVNEEIGCEISSGRPWVWCVIERIVMCWRWGERCNTFRSVRGGWEGDGGVCSGTMAQRVLSRGYSTTHQARVFVTWSGASSG